MTEQSLKARLLQFGPKLDVFEVAAREIEQGIHYDKPLLQALQDEWPDIPKGITFKDDGTPLTLRMRRYDREGYVGPRSHMPFERELPRYIIDGHTDPQRMKTRVLESEEPLIVVYPSRKEGGGGVDHEMTEHVFETYFTNCPTRLLPVFKTEGSASLSSKPLLRDNVRFYSDEPLPKDARYVIYDHIIESGRTEAAIRSLLVAQGVPDENILGAVYDESRASKNKLSAMRHNLSNFRAQDPITAAKCDILLDFIGFSGMNALTPHTCNSMEFQTLGELYKRCRHEAMYCYELPADHKPDTSANVACVELSTPVQKL